MWKSPITTYDETVKHSIKVEFDKAVIEAVQNVGIDVDKDELLKALQYDRGQYEKGYKEGFIDGYENGHTDGYTEGLEKGTEEDTLMESSEPYKGGDAEIPRTEQYPYMKQSPNSGADFIRKQDAIGCLPMNLCYDEEPCVDAIMSLPSANVVEVTDKSMLPLVKDFIKDLEKLGGRATCDNIIKSMKR